MRLIRTEKILFCFLIFYICICKCNPKAENMKNITMKSTQLIEDSYTNYHHSIYLYIYYRIGNKEEAEDLAQDVYVRLMDYNRILCLETIKYFIFTIARNLVNDYLRRYYKRQEVTSYIYEHTVAYTNETEARVVADDLEACENIDCLYFLHNVVLFIQ